MWEGSNIDDYTITIPPGVKVLKITTELSYVNEFVDPKLPIYIGVTGGKTYNMRWTYVAEEIEANTEYWSVKVYRYNSYSDFKAWVTSEAGESINNSPITSDVNIIMSYSASINGVTPNLLDY